MEVGLTIADTPLRDLIEQTAWEDTAVGPRETWPESLRTALGICLESRFPMIIFWGPELVQFYNDAYSRILAAKHPKALGQTARECWSEIWDLIGPMLHGVLENGQATWSENLLLQFDRSGSVEDLYFTFSYSPIRDASGVVGVFCAVTETTAQVLWERDAQMRAQALVELNAAKTDFFNNVSHEFRTPLTLMISPLDDLLDREDQLEPVVAETLRLIRRSGRRLQRLVNTLLDFARIEAQRLVPERQLVDLGRLTAEIAGTFRSTLESAGLTLIVEIDEELVGLIDPRLWEELVLNLLSNAFKFTFAGSIRVGLRRYGDLFRLTVADTGTGMTPDETSRAFERFWRGGNLRARTQEGSGIGLALVAEIASLHGGTASIESTPAAGTRVTVEVPAAVPHGDVRVARPLPASSVESFVIAGSSSELPAPGGARNGRARILVVDDNADLLGYVERLLGERYEVIVAGDGPSAQQRAFTDSPDLVLADVMIPGFDGIELMRRLRTDHRTKDTPIVLLTARAGDQDRGAGVGADDYIVKPFSKFDLFLSVERQLLRASARSEELSRFRDLADDLPNLVWTVDASGRPDWANRRMLDYTGITLDRVADLDAWRDVIPPEDFEALAAGQAAESLNPPGEFRLKHRDAPESAWRWHLVRSVPIRSSEGSVLRQVGSATDVHDQRLAAAVLSENLEREHRVAAAFQQAALPSSLPQRADVAISASYRPALSEAVIGGDWYDAFNRSDGSIVVSIGDAMGRGLDAAVVMSTVRKSIRAAAAISGDPAVILKAANEVLVSERLGELVTAFVAILDPAKGFLVCSNAGHVPPLLVTGGELREVGEYGLPLGASARTQTFTVQRLELPRPCMLVLYTDGLIEATRDILEGEKKLREVLSDRTLVGRDDAADAIAERFAATDDDVAVLTIALR